MRLCGAAWSGMPVNRRTKCPVPGCGKRRGACTHCWCGVCVPTPEEAKEGALPCMNELPTAKEEVRRCNDCSHGKHSRHLKVG